MLTVRSTSSSVTDVSSKTTPFSRSITAQQAVRSCAGLDIPCYSRNRSQACRLHDVPGLIREKVDNEQRRVLHRVRVSFRRPSGINEDFELAHVSMKHASVDEHNAVHWNRFRDEVSLRGHMGVGKSLRTFNSIEEAKQEVVDRLCILEGLCVVPRHQAYLLPDGAVLGSAMYRLAVDLHNFSRMQAYHPRNVAICMYSSEKIFFLEPTCGVAIVFLDENPLTIPVYRREDKRTPRQIFLNEQKRALGEDLWRLAPGVHMETPEWKRGIRHYIRLGRLRGRREG